MAGNVPGGRPDRGHHAAGAGRAPAIRNPPRESNSRVYSGRKPIQSHEVFAFWRKHRSHSASLAKSFGNTFTAISRLGVVSRGLTHPARAYRGSDFIGADPGSR